MRWHLPRKKGRAVAAKALGVGEWKTLDAGKWEITEGRGLAEWDRGWAWDTVAAACCL